MLALRRRGVLSCMATLVTDTGLLRITTTDSALAPSVLAVPFGYQLQIIWKNANVTYRLR